MADSSAEIVAQEPEEKEGNFISFCYYLARVLFFHGDVALHPCPSQA